MKIQLFALATATSLACANAASAQTVITSNIKPLSQIEINSAVNKNGGVQGSPQSVNVVPVQNASIISPATIVSPAQISTKSIGGIGGYTIPNVEVPKVIVNTNVITTTQIQANTAVLSKGVTQGGGQAITVQPVLNSSVSGRSADGAYIYNYNYINNYQKMYNNAYYSDGIKQGVGGQSITVSPTLTGTINGAKPGVSSAKTGTNAD
jgi:hypothetical protein